MKLITKDDFEEAEQKNPYYKNRWGYFESVVEFLKDKKFESVLEIGSYEFPVDREADTADIEGTPRMKIDLNIFEWPFKHYDLIIALQTLEHLADKKKSFREIKRLSNHALISLPYKWNSPEDKDHHMIDDKKIAEWTDNEPIKEKIINGNRIILFYDFTGNSDNKRGRAEREHNEVKDSQKL